MFPIKSMSVSMHILNLVKLYQLLLKKLSGNENLASVKGNNSVTYVRKMMCNNPNADHVNINAYTNFVKFYQFILKVLSGNETITDGMTDGRAEGMADNTNPVLSQYSKRGLNPGGGVLYFFFIRRIGPSIYRRPQKIQEFQEPQKIFEISPILYLDLKKRP